MNETDNIIEMRRDMSFLELIKENEKILIPKIQRDYAQGRSDLKTTEIRDSFLSAIFDTLLSDSAEPLLLDFIYGSAHKSCFTPLDGQQRLTTLFLLHWYFIPKQKKSLLLIANGKSCFSRLSYETRISSKDFCNALVEHSLIDLKVQLNNRINTNPETKHFLSDIIKDQSWFLWSWRNDPTVKAMLNMIDDIDQRSSHFDETNRELIWDHLEKGQIIFHQLPLEQFALTDELYVKMNARGKELSPFDIFKSTLEEQMRLNFVSDKIQNDWRRNIDSNWIDIFWNKLAKPFLNKPENELLSVNSVEKGYLNFFERMMVYHLFMNDDCLNINLSDDNLNRYIPFEYDNYNFLNRIRDYAVRNDIMQLMPLFNKTKFFNEDFFTFIIEFFKSFIYLDDNVKYNGSDLIEGINFETRKNLFELFVSDNIEYETRVQFYALIKFLEFNPAKNISIQENLKTELNSWMRIIRNLSTNSNSYFYNGYDDFLKSIKAIKAWSETVYSQANGNIVDFFKSQDKLDGFNGDQLTEEKTKAGLISNEEWKATIFDAEEHPYFLGQIRFLLEWSKVDDQYDIESFKKYKNQVCSIFDKDGLINELSDNHLFRNALMTVSDYYLYNDCFMQNTAKHRDFSWKRYLRESGKSENIKHLLDLFTQSDKSITEFLEERIIANTPKDWRRLFIEKPQIYNELNHHKISRWNSDYEQVCLLSKTRWSSKHKELKTFYLYLKYGCEGDVYIDSTNESHPFSSVFKRDINEFSVKFIPKNESQYVVSSNFNPNIELMVKNENNQRWEIYKKTSCFGEVEALINELNETAAVLMSIGGGTL